MDPPVYRLPQKEETSGYKYKRTLHRPTANADKLHQHLQVVLQKRNDGEDFILTGKMQDGRKL